MRVWVGCLGCYNAGHLFGYWVDAIDAPTTTDEWVTECRKRGQSVSDPGIYDLHEELWVFDHENFGGLLKGECSPSEAKRIAELVEDVSDLDAFKAYFDNVGGDIDTALEQFTDAYCGQYNSGADYAQELAEECDMLAVGGRYGEKPVDLSDRWPFTCIDWDRAWRELSMDGYSISSDGYVFRDV
jgi:antirestriction protein